MRRPSPFPTWWLVLLAACSIAGCDGYRRPVCKPADVRAYRAERPPELPDPGPGDLAAVRAGAREQVLVFPPSAGGPQSLSYWMRDGQDVLIGGTLPAVPLADATPSEPETMTATVIVLVDGRQVPISVDGQPAASVGRFQIVSPLDAERFTIRATRDLIPTEASSASVLLRDPRRSQPEHSPLSFTIFNGGTEFQPRAMAKGSPSGGWPALRRTDGRPLPASFAPSEAGDLTLAVKVGGYRTLVGCEDVVHGLALVALVDGTAVEMEALGWAPHFDLELGEAAVVDVTLRGLPLDRRPHTLSFYQVIDARYVEAPRGQQSPMAVTAAFIGRVDWK